MFWNCYAEGEVIEVSQPAWQGLKVLVGSRKPAKKRHEAGTERREDIRFLALHRSLYELVQ